jgi:predicted DNA-binding protein (MmcQ/YjbR family)
MNIENIREYILQKADVTEGFPFGEDTLVFKVMDKIFFLTGLQSTPLQFNVKCDPDKAIQLREEYPETVLPGYHMNKKHWNTVIVDGRLSAKQLKELIDDSYALVAPKKRLK